MRLNPKARLTLRRRESESKAPYVDLNAIFLKDKRRRVSRRADRRLLAVDRNDQRQT
jgi:hypothetical protein